MKMTDRQIVERILDGEYIAAEVFDILGDKILLVDGVYAQITAAQSEFEKMIIFDSVFPDRKFRQLIDDISTILEKRETFTYWLKNAGDKLLKASKLSSALRCYNLAASFAPANSQYAGELYADRAKTLLRLGRKTDCFKDIARSYHLDKGLKGKLLGLQFKCLQLTPEKDEEIGFKDQNQDYCDNVMFKTAGNPNPIIECGSDLVELAYDNEIGRHVIASKDIEAGVTVVVEEPYIRILNEIPKWGAVHCCYCLKRVYAAVHCRKCVFMSYCDEKCRRDDYKNGHRFECPCMPFVHGTRLAPFIHMCFKIICKAGPKELYEIYKKETKLTSDTQERDDIGIRGFDPKTGIYYSNSYHQIENLAYHDDFEGSGGCYLPWVSISLIRALDHKTNFFGMVDPADKSDVIRFTASKLLHHCHSIPFNGFAVYDDAENYQPTWNERMSGIEYPGIGNSIYSFISLFNHSCDPTVLRFSLPNGKMCLITNRKLKAGDPITVSYGYTYMNYERFYRQHEMEKDYRFTCVCKPCEYDWPIYDRMSVYLEYICPDCVGTFDHSNTDEARKRALNPFEVDDICGACGKNWDAGDFFVEAGDILIKFSEAQTLADEGNMVKAIPILNECVDYYQTKVLVPCINLISAQEVLKQCYEKIIEGSVHN